MIASRNLFFVNFLPKSFIIKLCSDRLFTVTTLLNRKKTKIRFLQKKKTKKMVITSNPQTFNYYINLNNTLQFNPLHFSTIKNNLIYLLRGKIRWTFKKFKYHGKGYKVKKFNKLSKITFRFGKSHWTKLLFNRRILFIKRTKKNMYCCISIRNSTFNGFLNLMRAVKGVNKYTKRGIRLTMQPLRRRFGKVSQASSVYK